MLLSGGIEEIFKMFDGCSESEEDKREYECGIM